LAPETTAGMMDPVVALRIDPAEKMVVAALEMKSFKSAFVPLSHCRAYTSFPYFLKTLCHFFWWSSSYEVYPEIQTVIVLA
jgi:hypothetical protein